MNEKKNLDVLTLEELEVILTPRQIKFVKEYELDCNATQAAIRAGYNIKNGVPNEKAAAVTGSRLLRNANISAYRRARVRELYNAAGISKESISLKLLDVYNQSMEGTPHMVWDNISHQYEPDGTFNFDSRGASKALELLGKTIGMFEDKIDINGKMVVFGGEDAIKD